jgi:methionyl-tRNA synthetase
MAPIFRETNHLFLDLPAFADRLAAWISEQSHWRANVRNFSLSFIEDLKRRPITRDLDWGVRVPVEGYAEQDNKRIYVWFDAVIGYLSAAIEWAQNRGEPEAWRDWWQNPAALHSYFMGKDNIVFHTVIWPSMLLGYGTGGEVGSGKPLELPHNVVASEFLTVESRQFSASRGVGILVRDFLSRYDPDPLRYYLTAAGPETHDTDFTWSEFVRRNNDELLAKWGNLVNRTLTSAYRNFGAVPTPGELAEHDRALIETVEGGYSVVGALIDQARFKAALEEAMRLASLVNQFIHEHEPWASLKTDRDRAATVLYVCLRCIDNLKILLTPFLPFTSQRLHELLGHEGSIAGPLEFRDVVEEEGGGSHTVLTGDYASWVGRWQPSELPPGQPLREPTHLFKKLDPDAVVSSELTRMERATAA